MSPAAVKIAAGLGRFAGERILRRWSDRRRGHWVGKRRLIRAVRALLDHGDMEAVLIQTWDRQALTGEPPEVALVRVMEVDL